MLHLIFIAILLCRPPGGAPVGELIKKLESGDTDARASAHDELLKRGENALPEIRKAIDGEIDPVAKAALSEIAGTIEYRVRCARIVDGLSAACRKEAPDFAKRLQDPGEGDVEDALLWARANAGRLEKCTQSDRIVIARVALCALDRHREESGRKITIEEVQRGFQADPERFYTELLPLVDHPDDGLRKWVLGEIPGLRRVEHAPDMLALLEGSPEERVAASRALGNMPAGAHSAAIAAALDRASPRAEIYLMKALRKTGDARYAGLFLARVDSPNLQARQEALLALLRIDPARGIPKLSEALDSGDEKALDLIVMVAAETNDPGIQAKVESVLRGAKTVGLRHNALYTLAGYGGERAVRVLVEALTGKDDNLRIGAAAAAVLVKDDRVADALEKLLDDANSSAGANAARSLAYIRPGVGPAKIRSFLNSQDPYVRATGLVALASLPDPKAEARIIELLSDSDMMVRFRAAETAGILRLASARAELLTRLEDPELFTRRNAAEALSRIREKSAIPVLADLLDADQHANLLEPLTDLASPSLYATMSTVVVRVDAANPGRVRDLVAALTTAFKDRGLAVHNELPEIFLNQVVEWHGNGLPSGDINAFHVLWSLYDSCCQDFGWFAAGNDLYLLPDSECCCRWQDWAKTQ